MVGHDPESTRWIWVLNLLSLFLGGGGGGEHIYFIYSFIPPAEVFLKQIPNPPEFNLYLSA